MPILTSILIVSYTVCSSFLSITRKHFNCFLAGGEEEEGMEPDADMSADGIPPTFTEKPKIIPNDTGTLVTMKFRVIFIISDLCFCFIVVYTLFILGESLAKS